MKTSENISFLLPDAWFHMVDRPSALPRSFPAAPPGTLGLRSSCFSTLRPISDLSRNEKNDSKFNETLQNYLEMNRNESKWIEMTRLSIRLLSFWLSQRHLQRAPQRVSAWPLKRPCDSSSHPETPRWGQGLRILPRSVAKTALSRETSSARGIPPL